MQQEKQTSENPVSISMTKFISRFKPGQKLPSPPEKNRTELEIHYYESNPDVKFIENKGWFKKEAKDYE